MHRVFRLFCGLAFSMSVALGAAETTMRISKPEVRDGIVAVIEAQLAAFRAGEVEKAYGYAAKALRAQTPMSAFARMAQKNYPEIWQSTRAEFAIVRDDGARAVLAVHLFTKTGDATYDYVLFKETEGWRIGTVLRHESRKSDVI